MEQTCDSNWHESSIIYKNILKVINENPSEPRVFLYLSTRKNPEINKQNTAFTFFFLC